MYHILIRIVKCISRRTFFESDRKENSMKDIKSEARFSMAEAVGVITGHGVGSGILAVPFLASRNSWLTFVGVIILAYCVNLLLHLMIAELSLNNDGAQFIKCFENELFRGKFKKIAGSYYRSNKAHLSEKNVEKLQICIRQTEEKYEFLSRIFPLNL